MDINTIGNKWNDFLDSDVEPYFEVVYENRKERLPETKKIIERFIEGKSDINIFYEEIKNAVAKKVILEGKHIRKTVWGANRFKGIIFFKILMESYQVDEITELHFKLREDIKLPNDIDSAKDKINDFVGWVNNFICATGDEKIRRITKPSYATFLISIFWIMQGLKEFPGFWTYSEKIFKQTDYYKPSNSNGENYKQFYKFNLDLLQLIKNKSKDSRITLQKLEGFFYYLGELHIFY